MIAVVMGESSSLTLSDLTYAYQLSSERAKKDMAGALLNANNILIRHHYIDVEVAREQLHCNYVTCRNKI